MAETSRGRLRPGFVMPPGQPDNLAARLQALTRDLDAAMVIDLATQRAAGEVAADFDLREQLRIRGRAKQEDVYLLPLLS